jgi:hypothetical protein
MFAIVYALAAQQLECRQRRLAKYARYRASAKGQNRTQRYNSSPAHQEAGRRWRLSHVRGEGSYQGHDGRWLGLMKVELAERAEALRVARNGGRTADITSAERLAESLGFDPRIVRD